MSDLRIFFGVGGVAPHDTPAAHRWAHRLRWPMTVMALLALPALWFDLSPPEVIWHHLGRVVWASLLLARTLAMARELFRATAALWLLAAGAILLALSGIGFYWLEPTVHNYGEGLWLAFVTGATVGYGDFVPTTMASRFFAMFTVLIGFGMLSLTTASIAVFFIEEDEKKLRREMHHDIRLLHEEVAALRAEIHALRADPPAGLRTDT